VVMTVVSLRGCFQDSVAACRAGWQKRKSQPDGPSREVGCPASGPGGHHIIPPSPRPRLYTHNLGSRHVLFDDVEEKKTDSGYVNRIRQLAQRWRGLGWPDITPITGALLEHEHADDRFHVLVSPPRSIPSRSFFTAYFDNRVTARDDTTFWAVAPRLSESSMSAGGCSFHLTDWNRTR
jgi:hypothetical protein